MANKFGFAMSKTQRPLIATLILAAPFLAFALAAQQQGPLPAPAADARQPAPPAQPAPAAPAPAAKPPSQSGNISHQPPAIPVEQIIQKFGDRDPNFKKHPHNQPHNQY